MKTRVLLAFAPHSSEKINVDVTFARRKILPALKMHCVHKGKQAIIIWEALMDDVDLDSGKSLSFKMKKRMVTLSDAQIPTALRSIQSLLDYNAACLALPFHLMDTGKRPSIYPFDSITLGDDIADINRNFPYRISSFLETQSAEAVHALWQYEVLSAAIRADLNNPATIKATTHAIRILAHSDILRDHAVVLLAEQFAAEDPNRLIVIPRGFYHRPMLALFDSSKFDLTVFERPLPLLFDAEAASLFYNGEVDPKMLEAYARLHVAYLRFVITFPNPSTVEEAAQSTQLARAHVIRANPELAAELGLEK